jgi:glycosyltransferase involved in cell wall biosynthesis
MNIDLILENDPYVNNSAHSNRIRSLIEPLANYGILLNLYIINGYKFNLIRVNEFNFNNNNISITYIKPLRYSSRWWNRFNIYIGSFFRSPIVESIIVRKIINNKSIIWTDLCLSSLRIVYKVKQYNYNRISFLEVSEFLDIHKYNKGNIFQSLVADKRKKYFEQKVFYSYSGISLMTKTLLMHFEKFPKPHPFFLHLPMTVDLERFDNVSNSLSEFQQPYIVFTGVMNDAKEGVSILIKSFLIISEKFPDYKLYLVGPWNYDTPIHLKLIKDYNLENRVFWVKEYPRDQIPNIICNASLLVLPRPDSKQARGGFPTKLGEYLASGIPVCATSVGELPDYLINNESVFFAEPGSFESFADCMDRALSNPNNAVIVGKNGRSVAMHKFNMDIQANILFKYFKEYSEKV